MCHHHYPGERSAMPDVEATQQPPTHGRAAQVAGLQGRLTTRVPAWATCRTWRQSGDLLLQCGQVEQRPPFKTARFCPTDITDASPLPTGGTESYTPLVSQLHGYIRTSRQQVGGVAGSDPLTQERQLAGAGVPAHLVFRDVGVSGRTGANTRTGWRALDARLGEGDTLVVASIDRIGWRALDARLGEGDTLVVASIDRIGRRWLNTLRTLCSLRDRGVRVRSLSSSEGPWVAYLDDAPDAPEAFIGYIVTALLSWVAEQEAESIRRRTIAGVDRARAAGKRLGAPRLLSDDQVEAARLWRDQEGMSYNRIGRLLQVSAPTVRRALERYP